MDSSTQNLFAFTITKEPLPDPLVDRLSSSARRRFHAMAHAAYEGDNCCISQIEEFLKEYPHLPKPYNFLASLYMNNGENEKGEAVIKEMYAKFPRYLFAKIAYAKLCMASSHIHEFEKIFEGKYNLKQLYPDRDEFHISELIAFTDVLCEHACHKRNFDFVRKTLQAFKSMDLDYQGIVKIIKDRLDHFENLSVMDRMLSKIQRSRKPGDKKLRFNLNY